MPPCIYRIIVRFEIFSSQSVSVFLQNRKKKINLRYHNANHFKRLKFVSLLLLLVIVFYSRFYRLCHKCYKLINIANETALTHTSFFERKTLLMNFVLLFFLQNTFFSPSLRNFKEVTPAGVKKSAPRNSRVPVPCWVFYTRCFT